MAAITFKEGIALLTRLNKEVSSDLSNNRPLLFDDDDSDYSQLYNAGYLIEFFLAQRTERDRLKAKRIARMLDTLLRDGDEHMRNEVLAGACESFSYPVRPDLQVDEIAAALPRYLRQAYLYEMGRVDSPFLEEWQRPEPRKPDRPDNWALRHFRKGD